MGLLQPRERFSTLSVTVADRETRLMKDDEEDFERLEVAIKDVLSVKSESNGLEIRVECAF